MSKVNEININIKKALMTSFDVELQDGGNVKLNVKGGLLTEQGKVVSDFWFSNSTWISDDKKLEIPVKVHMLIGEIFKEMTPVIYQKLNDSYKALPAKVVSTDKKKSDKKVTEEINPDDIPF